MYIAKMSGSTIVQIDHYRTWFKNPPDDATLVRRGYKKVNKYLAHDRLTQKLQSTTPFVDGDFVTTVKVVSLTADEIAANKASSLASIRSTRNNLLEKTDWAVIRKAETSTAMPSAMATYRQALRDIPSTIGSADPRTWSDYPTISLDGSTASGV
jgi:hypothetical protein